MTTVRDFVDVVIERETRGVSQQGFGTPLVAASVVPVTFTERVRFYTDAANMLDDGFDQNDDAYKAVRSAFSQTPRPIRVGVGRVDLVNETWTEGLGAIASENNEWYALIATTNAEADVLEIAAWVESYSTTKLYGTRSSDPNGTVAAAETDIGYLLEQLGYVRTFTFWNEDPTTFPEAALFGRCLAANPGSITWQFKELAGIVPSDGLSETQVLNLKNKNYVYFQTVGGARITINPKVAQGEWIDIVHGTDWLQARITERIYGLLVNLPKLPFTDAGITAIQSQIAAQLDAGIKTGFLTNDPPYVITVPKARDVPANEKAQRTLNGVEFVAYLAGAIHHVGIHGVVKY